MRKLFAAFSAAYPRVRGDHRSDGPASAEAMRPTPACAGITLRYVGYQAQQGPAYDSERPSLVSSSLRRRRRLF